MDTQTQPLDRIADIARRCLSLELTGAKAMEEIIELLFFELDYPLTEGSPEGTRLAPKNVAAAAAGERDIVVTLPRRVYGYISEVWANGPDDTVAAAIAHILTEMVDADRETPER